MSQVISMALVWLAGCVITGLLVRTFPGDIFIPEDAILSEDTATTGETAISGDISETV